MIFMSSFPTLTNRGCCSEPGQQKMMHGSSAWMPHALGKECGGLELASGCCGASTTICCTNLSAISMRGSSTQTFAVVLRVLQNSKRFVLLRAACMSGARNLRTLPLLVRRALPKLYIYVINDMMCLEVEGRRPSPLGGGLCLHCGPRRTEFRGSSIMIQVIRTGGPPRLLFSCSARVADITVGTALVVESTILLKQFYMLRARAIVYLRAWLSLRVVQPTSWNLRAKVQGSRRGQAGEVRFLYSNSSVRCPGIQSLLVL